MAAWRDIGSLRDPDRFEAWLHRLLVRELGVEQRTALVMHHYLGYSVPEIADALRVPIGTVKSRIHRGTVAMRAALDADETHPRLPEGQLA